MVIRSARGFFKLLAVIVFAAAVIGGPLLYYRSVSAADRCSSCHEIGPSSRLWENSTHRGVECASCHGSSFTIDAGFQMANLRRAVTHASGEHLEQLTLAAAQILQMSERCGQCHRQELAEWKAGPHGVGYKEIFTDQEHNRKRPLMDDCLRCHGMHFEGSIAELVTPLNLQGPWKLIPAALEKQAAIPCLGCHHVHHEGSPLARQPRKAPRTSSTEPITLTSVALFDRRARRHVPVGLLPLPNMSAAGRAVKMSTDQRQALCYQCHAPAAGAEVRTGDDRTPTGVHEGISCLACHSNHAQRTRASCSTCHPAMSNCGLDVEKMDTTFRSTQSKHNIHAVRCLDCHPRGVPKPKQRASRTE